MLRASPLAAGFRMAFNDYSGTILGTLLYHISKEAPWLQPAII
jgi:hypothetical protein